MLKKKSERKKKTIQAAILMAGATVLFSGCRPSPILQQTQYTDDASAVDNTQKQLDPDDNGEQDDRLKNKEIENSDTIRDTKNSAGKQDDSSDSSGKSVKINYDSKSSSDNSGETDLSGGLEELQDADNPNGGNDSSDGGDNQEDNGASDTTPGQSGKTNTVTDADGKKVKVPENVKTVTAVGAAAAMVEMVGGKGRLVGSSESFTDNDFAKSIISEVGSGTVKTWWDDDGSEAISDGSVSGKNFQALLKAKPQVCFVFSGEDTFSDKQLAALKKAGIICLTLPALSSDEKLKDAVQIIAETLLTNKTAGRSAGSIADDYSAWVDNVISDVKAKSGDTKIYSEYIAAWDDSVSYTLKNTYDALPSEAGLSGNKGSGVAIGWSEKKASLITTFINAAGITNESSESKAFADKKGVYVTPMFHQFSPAFSSSAYSYYDGTGAGYDYFVSHRLGNDSYALLGTSNFPAIIVANKDVKEKIELNWFWQYHGEFNYDKFHWKSGYLNTEKGIMFYGSIGGDYDIYVNPYGLGDWAAGSVDSPLEAYWAAYRISGDYSKSSLNSKVSSFYENFFDADLSTSQLKTILGD